jgi:oligopeptide transport system permease protein
VTAWVLRRIGGALVTFVAATMVVFAVTFALPGDPALAVAGGRKVSPSTLDAIRVRYHLDESLPSQYLHWLGRLVRGDLGESYSSRRPVTDMLLAALPVTVMLLAITLVIEIVAALVVGTWVGMRRGGPADRAVVALCTIGIAAPTFVVASVGQYLFGVRWGILPVAGTDDGPIAYVLPALVLAIAGAAFAVRIMRTEVLEQAHLPHVRTAVSKGIAGRQVTRRHVVRNSLITIVTFFGLEVGALIGGSVVVERVFNLPGVGNVIARAISQRDNVVVIGFTMFVIAVYLVVDLVIDVVAMLLDPRLRAGSS